MDYVSYRHLIRFFLLLILIREFSFIFITGLDPSAPYFEHTGPKVRLDPTDAKFVDVIHTDIGYILGLGIGINGQSGHVDFYPNGGKYQPGCTEYKTLGSVIGGVVGWLNKLKPGK